MSTRSPERTHESDDELREKYGELLQELRVVLPGVQVLLAFLLTVPFNQRFEELDTWGTALFTAALFFSATSTVTFLAPTALHRVPRHSPRRDRLEIGTTLTIAGLVQLALAVTLAVLVVLRHVHGTEWALVLTAPVALSIVFLWWVLPVRHDDHRRAGTDPR